VVKIRWGIIGLGHMANVFAQSISQLDNSTLLAISSKDVTRLKNFSKNYHFDDRYCFRNYEALLSCKEIDIVYIAITQ
jgi:predicted dehydrogenase